MEQCYFMHRITFVRFKGSAFRVQRFYSEQQNRRIMNRRMSKGGFALLNLYYKIDRIHSFDTCPPGGFNIHDSKFAVSIL